MDRAKIKDYIYIISAVCVFVGWYVSNSNKDAVIEVLVKANTALANANAEAVKLHAEKWDSQHQLNGGFIQWMKIDSERHE